MRTRLVVGFAVAALGASTLACNTAANPYAEVSEYCTAYAKAICQAGCEFHPTTCQSFQESQCNGQADQATASGTRQYQPGNVQSCLDAVNAAYDNATRVTAAQVQSITSACARVFLGAAGEGAACTSDFDCAGKGDICASAPGVSTDACAQPTAKQLGDDCADRGDQCPTDAYCAPQTGTSVCVAAQAAGQTCSSALPCDSESHCVTGSCQPLATLGEPCNSDADCTGSLFCDLNTDAVVPTPTCVSSYSFSLGSDDCIGLEGTSTGGTSNSDAGSSSDAPSGD
jgi:hypothetical protein